MNEKLKKSNKKIVIIILSLFFLLIFKNVKNNIGFGKEPVNQEIEEKKKEERYKNIKNIYKEKNIKRYNKQEKEDKTPEYQAENVTLVGEYFLKDFIDLKYSRDLNHTRINEVSENYYMVSFLFKKGYFYNIVFDYKNNEKVFEFKSYLKYKNNRLNFISVYGDNFYLKKDSEVLYKNDNINVSYDESKIVGFEKRYILPFYDENNNIKSIDDYIKPDKKRSYHKVYYDYFPYKEIDKHSSISNFFFTSHSSYNIGLGSKRLEKEVSFSLSIPELSYYCDKGIVKNCPKTIRSNVAAHYMIENGYDGSMFFKHYLKNGKLKIDKIEKRLKTNKEYTTFNTGQDYLYKNIYIANTIFNYKGNLTKGYSRAIHINNQLAFKNNKNLDNYRSTFSIHKKGMLNYEKNKYYFLRTSKKRIQIYKVDLNKYLR